MSFLFKHRRASVGLEAVMALPVIMVLFGAVAQVLITSQSRVHLEQAAYAAARSALAYKCPPRTLSINFLRTECFRNRSGLDAIAQRKAEDAARWALVAAAPTTGAAFARGCSVPDAGVEVMTGGNRIAGRDQALRNALCYVQETANLRVELEWVTTGGLPISLSERVPIRATVHFRYPLSTPFRRFLMNQGISGKRGDGTYWRESSATVVLI
ncbi:MAG: hypothetical protein ABJF50_22765 [Paracoccaceae bacterium]